jgi:putative membrane protein
MQDAQERFHPVAMLVAFSLGVLGWSVYHPSDAWVWLFEILPGVIGVSLLAATCRAFRFSRLAYVLVAVHFTILAIGAKYTYAGMPLFTWLQEVMHLSRNHYDRVGHFAQGFIPAILAREILLRRTPLGRGKMLFFLVVSVCLAIAASWELIEWWVVIFFYPEQGTTWLGLQGDPWDAQSDMFLALTGSMAAQVLLSRAHDRSMACLPQSPRSPAKALGDRHSAAASPPAQGNP